jgi:hypothetical protein
VAVLFRDRAELLACLAADWCEHPALGPWWWTYLLPPGDRGRVVATLWLAAPEHVPAALAVLAARRRAVRFARVLPPPAAVAIAARLAERFGLPELGAALAELPAGTDPRATPARGAAAIPQVDRPAEPAPPWHRWAPESTDGVLSPAAQLLLGVGLTLARAPALARSKPFTRAVRDWARGERSPASRRDAALPAQPAAAAVETSRPVKPAERSLPETAGTAHIAPGAAGEDLHGPAPAAGDPVTARRRNDIIPEDRSTSQAAAVAPASVAGPSTPTGDHWSATSAAPLGPWPETVVETRLGGIFYLINLALALDLYPDFSRPLASGLSLDPWDFLTLVARRLWQQAPPDDAVWALLAGLAGREEGVAPGAGFAPPRCWRLPPDWLDAFSTDDRWGWTVAGGRLRVLHPAGFVVVDLPTGSGLPARRLARALAPYRAVAPALRRRPAGSPGAVGRPRPEAAVRARGGRGRGRPGRPSRSISLDRERWLDGLVAYLRARLERALAPEPGVDVGWLLLEHRARITATATHLDVFLGLGELPIAIRLAGLDRDPGWVPAAGRFIAFHFD